MLPRKPVTTVATEAMATVESLKGDDMLRLIFDFLLCICCFFAFLEGCGCLDLKNCLLLAVWRPQPQAQARALGSHFQDVLD